MKWWLMLRDPCSCGLKAPLEVFLISYEAKSSITSIPSHGQRPAQFLSCEFVCVCVLFGEG
jgi:hypothetical protein